MRGGFPFSGCFDNRMSFEPTFTSFCAHILLLGFVDRPACVALFHHHQLEFAQLCQLIVFYLLQFFKMLALSGLFSYGIFPTRLDVSVSVSLDLFCVLVNRASLSLSGRDGLCSLLTNYTVV